MLQSPHKGWIDILNTKCDSDVETDDSIHTPRGYRFITHIRRLSGREGAEEGPKCPKNGLRNPGRGSGVASLMTREWGQRVGFCLGVWFALIV